MTAALSSITCRIGNIARAHDVATLDGYVGSEAFLALFGEVPPSKRACVFAAYHTARASCMKRKPVAAPKTAKADWKKPGEIERFKRAWLRHGGNKYLVAREMGITEGAVGVAYSRFVRHGATATYTPVKKPAGKAQDGRDVSRAALGTRHKTESVAPVSAAA